MSIKTRKPPLFQSTLPRGERPIFANIKFTTYNFNPRSREGSDLHQHAGCVRKKEYFNPRSREGSDDVDCFLHKINIISIHAPARGATIYIELSANDPRISIHAPARGATTIVARQGADVMISIHAPARGATLRSWFSSFLQHFNPRSREGSDRLRSVCCKIPSISIHAPARGATAHGKELGSSHAISIHAPARGATARRSYFCQ